MRQSSFLGQIFRTMESGRHSAVSVRYRTLVRYNPRHGAPISVEGAATLSGLGLLAMWMGLNPTGPPVGDSMEEMMRIFVGQRDKEFDAHLCAEHVHKMESRRRSA